MQFFLSLIAPEPDFAEIDPAEMQEIIDMMGAYNKELHAAGAWVTGGGLQALDQSRTVKFPEGEGEISVSDGPFAETKEQLAGFWIIECESTDKAVEWAKKAPLSGGGASLEIRPLGDEIGEFKVLEDRDTDAQTLLDAAQGKGNQA